MSIWKYTNTNNETSIVLQNYMYGHCIYCKSALTCLEKSTEFVEEVRKIIALNVCQKCGWWIIEKGYDKYFGKTGIKLEGQTSFALSTLKRLSLSDINLPISDVKKYLLIDGELRFKISPKLFEEVVGDVFKDLGFHAVVTEFRSDGGIDIILNKGNEFIGIQVKRYNNSIEVEQIRSLIGALVIKGFTKGIFVTTSKYQKGAYTTIEEVSKKGFEISLINGTQFLDALKIVKIPEYIDNVQFWNMHPKIDYFVYQDRYNGRVI